MGDKLPLEHSPLSQGPWMRLEEAVRILVREWQTVWVMTGPLYEHGSTCTTVPSDTTMVELSAKPTGRKRIIWSGSSVVMPPYLTSTLT